MNLVDALTSMALLFALIVVLYQRRVIRSLRAANATKAEEMLTGMVRIGDYLLPLPTDARWKRDGREFRLGHAHISSGEFMYLHGTFIDIPERERREYVRGVKRNVLDRSMIANLETP